MKKITIAAAIVICALSLVLFVASNAQAKREAPAEGAQWTVHRGETLWEIASRNRGNTEIRRYIYQIQKLNGIGTTIYPGQVLELPGK
jgi:nucleoid-associated protein YgaU